MSEPKSSSTPAGCRECGEVNWHRPNPRCSFLDVVRVSGRVTDAERALAEPRHPFVGQYGLGNKFCAYPIGLHQCLKPREAEIHQVAEPKCIHCGAAKHTFTQDQDHEFTPQGEQVEPLLCDACGRSMTFENVSLVGATIQFSDGDKAGMMAAIYPEIPSGREFNVCLVCWLRSLGVKVPLAGKAAPPADAPKFQSFNLDGREIVRVDEGNVTIADDATKQELCSAIVYLIRAINEGRRPALPATREAVIRDCANVCSEISVARQKHAAMYVDSDLDRSLRLKHEANGAIDCQSAILELLTPACSREAEKD